MVRESCSPSFGGVDPKMASGVVLVNGEVPNMPNTPVEFMENFVKYRTARDVPACSSLVTDDIQIVTPFGKVEGRKDAEKEFGKPVPNFVLEEPLHLKPGEDEVVVRKIHIAKGPFKFEFIQQYELVRDERGKLKLSMMSMIKADMH